MRVLIVGGGSAGWIAAATVLFQLNGGRAGPVSVTVLELPDVPRIGVGEATIPTIRNMLAGFGFSEADFIRACDATIKHAIRFDDWAAPGSRALHPFQRFSDAQTRMAVPRWLESDGSVPFDETVSVQGHLIRAGLAPRALQAGDYGGAIPYAYHMDAEMFAATLMQRCLARGVTRREGHVAEVMRAPETGWVSGLRMADGQALDADLYIDCTGFHRVLHDPAGPDDWVDQSHHLLCDRAVAMRVPREPSQPVLPYTRARALSAGWCWDIGLRTRRGRGYVFSSAFLDDEAAEAELRADEGPGAEGCEARVIPFRVGRRAAPWQGNVVCAGLSAGFLEPLESTGLYFAHLAARLLCEMFPTAPADLESGALASRFNRRLRSVHDDALDFILVHYATAGRRDTAFWRAASDPARLTDSLREKLAVWQVRPPRRVDMDEPFGPFSHVNYEFILLGNGWRPAGSAPGRAPCMPHPGIDAAARGLPTLDAFMAAMERAADG